MQQEMNNVANINMHHNGSHLVSGSPSRNNSMVKRKMPDTFYKPPCLKTQVFSSMDPHQQPHRSIHHAHTNSLPVDSQLLSQPIQSSSLLNHNPAISANSLYERLSSPLLISNPGPLPSNPISVYSNANTSNSTTVNQINSKSLDHQPANSINSNLITSNPQITSLHSKTFSLPVAMNESLASGNLNANPYSPMMMPNSQQILPPPVRSNNSTPYGDIPLPPDWYAERTLTGQIYYINHVTKVTTWEDPRKQFSLPINQNEINGDLKETIIKTIPLPSGWQEARTATGEIYFINHNNHTTCWEDPRLSIYMKTEQQKYFSHNYAGNNANPLIFNQQQQLSSCSSSSLYSSPSVLSNSSSCSSLNSITINQSNNSFNKEASSNKNSFTSNTSTTSNQQFLSNSMSKNNTEQFILSLKKSLDELSEQKASLCNQLHELSKQEMDLKSKLSPQDLDDIMKTFKKNDSSIPNMGNQSLHKANLISSANSDSISIIDQTVDMDSTLVVGESSSQMP